MGYWDVRVRFDVFHRGDLASYLTRYSAGKLKVPAIDWLKRYASNNDGFVLIVEVKVAHKVEPTAELIVPMSKGHTMQRACKGGQSVPIDCDVDTGISDIVTVVVAFNRDWSLGLSGQSEVAKPGSHGLVRLE
jgi:hypothetical protein